MTFASTIEIPTAPHSIDADDEREKFTPNVSAFGAHHLYWLECLQKVEDGEIKRLMGLMPPGSGKSVYSSVVFPTHFLGRFPKRSIIVASYGSDLPRKFGRRARSIVTQPMYKRIFDTSLSEESAAVDEWALTNGSEWMAKGILTGITGNRVDGIIWDDLIKGREQADSKAIRDKTWDAYMDDLQTRRKPSTFEVGITTRWHEDDPAGRILPPDYDGASGLIKCQDGNDWYVVCLPAIAERDDDPLGRKPGDILWPEWFTEQHFAPFKRNPRSWSALFQQRPAPDTGDYFESAWLVPYSRPIDPPSPIEQPRRETLTVYGASDYAVTADGGDYTVHVVVGIDPTNRVFLLDLWRKQASADKWIEAFCDMVERWRPIGWAEETGQIKSGIGPFLVKRLRERRLYLARAQFSPKGDKAIRAQSIRGRMAMDGLYVPIFAPWYPDLRRELLSFPAGKHDDQCLVSGTLIKMADGRDLPIETVKEGDIVATPCGPKRVLASKKTNAAAQVYKVLFSNGQHLISTGGHPIYVHKKGFVPVDALGIMDRVEPFKEHDLCVEVGRLKLHHQLSIMGIVTGFMKGVHIMRHHHHGLAIYIDMFGKILTVQFQKIVTYTTLMKTQQIITQTILNVLRRPNTEESIQCLVPAWNGSGHIWLEYGHWPMLGIKPKQDVNRCGGPQSLVGLIGRRLKKSVNVVNKNLKQLLKQEVDAVPEPVVSVSGLVVLTERMAVHNLTVEDAHVYYANGILTHNCDALGLIGQVLDKMVSGKMLAPEPEKPKVLSTDPTTCTVTLTDMFEAHEKRGKYHVSRIH